MNLANFLDRAALLWPRNVAVVDGAVRLDYAALTAHVDGLAAALAARGVGRGDRIATLCDNRWELLALYFAAARLGALLVPGNTRLVATEHDRVFAKSRPTLLCAETAHRTVVERLASPLPCVWIGDDAPAVARARGANDATFAELATPRARPPHATTTRDDVAHLYFTSGTTGQPKGVMLTHGNVSAHAIATIAELRLDERDVWAHIAPMFHLADAWATFAITAVGGRHVFLDRFDAAAALALIARERVTITNLVPTMLNRMVHEPTASLHDLSSLRRILSGGAPIAPETVRAIVRVFRCEYVQTYGMTETSPYLTFSLLSETQRARPDAAQLAIASRTGRPVLGVELRVVDVDGQPVAPNDRTVGEIQVRGPTVTPGYWEDPAATAAAFTPDGFLHTGDLATVDAEGSVRIVDRKKDVIKTGGETVFSTEVEFRLHEHPAVLEAAVYGVPDADLGERVTAAVALKPDASVDAATLIAFCRETLAGFKTPRAIHFVDALPRTGSGKITKTPLRTD